MSRRELQRLERLSRVKSQTLSLVAAAEKMGVSYRHAKRLWRRYQARGEAGLLHGLRGQPSNRRTDRARRQRIVELYRTKYHDFGVTLAAEYLLEEDRLSVPVEPLRLAASVVRGPRQRTWATTASTKSAAKPAVPRLLPAPAR